MAGVRQRRLARKDLLSIRQDKKSYQGSNNLIYNI